jgi:predicted esterase
MGRSLCLLTLLLAIPAARADLIFLKDGTVIQGKTKNEKGSFTDPVSHETYMVATGFYFVDDGARRFFFSPGQVQSVDTKFLAPQDGVFIPRKGFGTFRLPYILEVQETSSFDEKWNRSIKFLGPERPIYTTQQMTFLSSSFAALVCTKDFPWTSFYVTQELGYDTVRKLLIDNPEFHDPKDLPIAKRADRRFRLYHFMVHAGWLTEAESELDRIDRDLPSETKRVEEARDKLRKLKIQKYVGEIQKADQVGRRKWVAEQLANFPEKYATPRAIEQMRTLKAGYTAADDKVKEVRTALADLRMKLKNGEKQSLTPALLAVEAELHPQFIDRLDLFLEQVKQAARQEKTKGKADQSPGELLSLAITGWMLGSSSAEAKVETARRVWRGREMIQKFVTGKEADRQNVFKADTGALPSVDQLVQILALSPPLKPDEKLPVGITQQKAMGTSYHLQLPDEYHPGRPYPVLIALHQVGEESKDIMDRWARLAKEEGYILAAPSWPQGAGAGYGFTSAEHDTVLDTMTDLRKRFNVDTDRVFLTGMGQGGTMAFDVGLSHPDLFAGVLPMCGCPMFFCREYAANAQYLPMYIVSGEWQGDSSKWTKEFVEKLVPAGYPVMHVQYKGRGQEWFGAELPAMFDWMSRKKRTIPATQLGKYNGGEFRSMRTTDNRFYWLSSDGIQARHVNSVAGWKKVIAPATLWGYVNPVTNQVYVNSMGHQKVTVWLSRDAKMDFEKPMEIKLNGARAMPRKVSPSLLTVLEDFAARGDRQRPFIAQITLTER